MKADGGGEGRRIPCSSPSYLGSEPSAGKSMAGGAGTAPAALPSASRSAAPETPPSIAGRARETPVSQPSRQPGRRRRTLPVQRSPPDPEAAPRKAGDLSCPRPERRRRRPRPVTGPCPPFVERGMGWSRAGASLLVLSPLRRWRDPPPATPELSRACPPRGPAPLPSGPEHPASQHSHISRQDSGASLRIRRLQGP